jgi:osmotically-inducible protein OsmY
MHPDMELRHEVLAALSWDPTACCAAVDVRVENGVVTLTGQLASAALRDAVERAVQRVQSMKALVTNLTVQPVLAEARSDAGGTHRH